MRRQAKSSSSFNFTAIMRKVDGDDWISLRNCFCVADDLLSSNRHILTKKRKKIYILVRYTAQIFKISWFNASNQERFPGIHFLDQMDFVVNGWDQMLRLCRAQLNYPTDVAVDASENSSVNQVGQHDPALMEDSDSKLEKSTRESVISIDAGRWSQASEESDLLVKHEKENNDFHLGHPRQPMPPPIQAQVHPELLSICASRVSDLTPGCPKLFKRGLSRSSSYQDLHIPVKMMDEFLRLAWENTTKNLETCGILAGSLRNRVFHITTLIIPKQESTSDTCQTLNEEEIFEVQDKRSLFPLGWIHTHPTQTCFMSSVDLHTHYSYQVMLPEAVAIVMAPTDTSTPHGIFHLSDPGGVAVIRNCQERGFHPHEEPDDGSTIYEECSHVYMNSSLSFDVVDLR